MVACHRHLYGLITEGVNCEGVKYCYIASGHVLESYAPVVLNSDVSTCAFKEGVADHCSDFVDVVEGLVGDSEHTAEGGITLECFDHLVDNDVATGIGLKVEVFGLLTHNFAAVQGQCDIGGSGQFVLVLGNEHAIVERFI